MSRSPSSPAWAHSATSRRSRLASGSAPCCSLLWAVALAAALLFPLMFPTLQTASFFSTTLVEPREPFDLVSLYIPIEPVQLAREQHRARRRALQHRRRASRWSRFRRRRGCSRCSASSARQSRRPRDTSSTLTPYGIFAIARGRGRNAQRGGAPAAPGVSGELRGHLAAPQPVGACPGWSPPLTPVPYGAVLSQNEATP